MHERLAITMILALVLLSSGAAADECSKAFEKTGTIRIVTSDEDVAQQVAAEEITEPARLARVEQAFKDKYGFVQRVMSFFRMAAPEVLRLTPAP